MSKTGTTLTPRVISVTSGKGGVGKTSLVVNLASALTKRNKRVIILDADLGLANVDVFFGIAPDFNIKHVLTGERKLKEIMVKGPHGIRVIPASSGIEELARLTPDQKLALLAEFEELETDFDVMIIDTATGISSDVAYFNTAAQHTLVILCPEPASLTDAYALIKLLYNNYCQRDIHVVVNGANDLKEAREIFYALSNVCMKFLGLSLDWVGFIPRDSAFVKATKQQKILMDTYPQSPSAQAIRELASKLMSWPMPQLKGTYQFFWTKLLETPKCGEAQWSAK